jgi:predicted dehydrogenase
MIDQLSPLQSCAETFTRGRPLGFVGVGWIGRNRMDAATASGQAEVAVLVDPFQVAVAEAAEAYPSAEVLETFDDLSNANFNGVVIATPSALHAAQSIAILEHELPVFCQKPLGRNAGEPAAVIKAAKSVDRLLDFDLPYRFTEGIQEIHQLVRRGELGEIISIEAVFHHAYGPGKTWFYSRESSGGGCLLNLEIHLVDLAMWRLDFPEVEAACGLVRESSRGEIGDKLEDFATGLIRLDNCGIQLSTSWGSHAGCDAEIRLQLFGTKGGDCFRHVNGSFHHFIAERFHPDRSPEVLAGPSDDWGGRVIVAWVRALALSRRFEPEIQNLAEVAGVLDQLYLKKP